MARRIISIAAIIIGLIVHGRFLILLLGETNTAGGNIGLLVVPAYAFLTSLLAYGFLGLLDLNKTTNGKAYLWTATIISTLTLLVGGLYMPISGYVITGLLFIGLNTVPFMIRKDVNLNAITVTINILAILVAPFSFGTL